MTKHKLGEFDVIFLSYDEPNAELLFAELSNICPWAKRVHGIKGFDTAHRACADASETKFFITVDGDNRVYPEFFELEIDIVKDQFKDAWTWAGRNYTNGLVYGNGGLKLWSKEFVYSMNSHENATDPSQSVDFCWSPHYHEMEGCYSETISNGSPYQAWRAGFREGVKMSLDRGNRVPPNEFHSRLWYGNVNRLSIWANIGQDVENGIWSIYGARLGCYFSTLTTEDYTMISDYVKMAELWQTIKDCVPEKESIILGEKLNEKLGLNLVLYPGDMSKHFKQVYVNPPRPFVPDDRIAHFMATRHV